MIAAILIVVTMNSLAYDIGRVSGTAVVVTVVVLTIASVFRRRKAKEGSKQNGA